MRIALAQIKSGTEPTANLGLVEDYTRRAADAGGRLVLFPEATMCRFGVPLAPIAEPLDGSWASAVRAIAERAGVVIFLSEKLPPVVRRGVKRCVGQPLIERDMSHRRASLGDVPCARMHIPQEHPVGMAGEGCGRQNYRGGNGEPR